MVYGSTRPTDRTDIGRQGGADTGLTSGQPSRDSRIGRATARLPDAGAGPGDGSDGGLGLRPPRRGDRLVGHAVGDGPGLLADGRGQIVVATRYARSDAPKPQKVGQPSNQALTRLRRHGR